MFSGLAFFLLLPLMKRTETISLDTDWIWRVLLFQAGTRAYRLASATGTAVANSAAARLSEMRDVARRYLGGAGEVSRPGVFARAWPIGVTALLIAMLLAGYVLIYYF
jgi:multicomponent Na+:H+ antiporter subunit D